MAEMGVSLASTTGTVGGTQFENGTGGPDTAVVLARSAFLLFDHLNRQAASRPRPPGVEPQSAIREGERSKLTHRNEGATMSGRGWTEDRPSPPLTAAAPQQSVG